MLALAFYEAGLCRKCGTPLCESTSPDNNPDDARSPRMYVAETPIECMACKVLVRSEREWAEEEPDLAPALIHTAVLVDRSGSAAVSAAGGGGR